MNILLGVFRFIGRLLAKKIYVWVVVVIFLFPAVFYAYVRLNPSSFFGSNSSYSMVKYLEKANEKVFLNVGIQDVLTQKNDTKIPWTNIGIPLTQKRAIMIVSYEAKLGIKKPVKILPMGNKKFHIEVPQYQVIGVKLDEKKPYTVYDEGGELLSITTENIDKAKIVTQTLSNKKQEEYLKQYTEMMDESAKDYYQELFKSVDPEIQLEFSFKH
ncbi:DUF4230 domain-containing protein [Streptococcus oricebi]|uniref:Phosphoribosylglycinamide synthetase n=1 Tax=Streptococcus oricebi TaxID=1547447 RepID=A0ABS5B3C8_9STRE|nr:DUF4230 domain-containing protein [Streptococcus oricebi]MBP2623335.1 phosphoribosylglycinamide synthetase [Streptococcus oricebi]